MLVLDDAAAGARCLDSIAAAGGPSREIVVVANGTSDKGLEPLRGRDDHVLLRLAANTGFSGGCNLGGQIATADHLVFLNDDVVVEPGWLEPLVDAASREPDLGAVGSLVLFPDGRIQDAGGYVWRNGVTSRLGFGERGLPPGAAGEHAADYVSACSMLVPRRAWERAGGMDTRFFPAYYEDVDLCLRMHALGLRIICEPASRVRHDVGHSTEEGWRQFIITRNHARLMERWRDELVAHEEPAELEGPVLEHAVLRAMQRTAFAA